MKYLALLITAVTLLFPGIAATQSADKGVVVVAKPVTPAQWSRTITRKLDGAIRYPTTFSNEIPPSGIVSVRFHAGGGGLPTALSITRTSGVRSLDRAAMSAIARIKTLGPMPATFRTDQRFIANILFATDQKQFSEQMAILRRETTSRSAAVRGPNAPIVLAFSSHAGVGSQ